MDTINSKQFMRQLWRYKKGSISRRDFMGSTGLGFAMSVMAANMPELLAPRSAHAAGPLGNKVVLATWPNYHDPANFEKFTKATGVNVDVNVFGSNEEMLAKLQAGGSGWDVFVPTNYTISTYVKLGLIEPLDVKLLSNYDANAYEGRFSSEGTVNGKLYAISKNWGTTGFVVNSKKGKKVPTSWKEFWDMTMTSYSKRTMVHDYQLTTIGSAMRYFGYPFNSVDPKHLADVEKLLLKVKPHLFAINSDYQPPMRNGDAWMTMCWSGEGLQLHRDMPEMTYVIAKDGGEIWSDYFAVPKGAPHREAAYALINFLLKPENNVNEVKVHGFPTADKRTKALLPKELVNDPIIYPAASVLTPLEFGAAATLVNPLRAEIMARFKSA